MAKKGTVSDVSITDGHRPMWTTQNSRGNSYGSLTDEEMEDVGIGFMNGKFFFDLKKIYG